MAKKHKKIKDDDWHFRCNHEEKLEGKRLLKEINKPADFLLTFFLREFNTNSSRLRAEIHDIDTECEAINKEMESLQNRLKELDERKHDAEIELNNTSLYDLENYRNSKSVMGAIGSIKRYVIQREIKHINDIPNTVINDIDSTFKVYDTDLLKEISSHEFNKWQMELKANEEKESDNVKMTKIYDRMLSLFRGQIYIKDWQQFLKTKEDDISRKAKTNGWNPEELRTFLYNKTPVYSKDKKRR